MCNARIQLSLTSAHKSNQIKVIKPTAQQQQSLHSLFHLILSRYVARFLSESLRSARKDFLFVPLTKTSIAHNCSVFICSKRDGGRVCKYMHARAIPNVLTQG